MNDALQRFAGKGSHSLKVTKHLASAVLVDAITFALDHQSLALEITLVQSDYDVVVFWLTMICRQRPLR